MSGRPPVATVASWDSLRETEGKVSGRASRSRDTKPATSATGPAPQSTSRADSQSTSRVPRTSSQSYSNATPAGNASSINSAQGSPAPSRHQFVPAAPSNTQFVPAARSTTPSNMKRPVFPARPTSRTPSPYDSLPAQALPAAHQFVGQPGVDLTARSVSRPGNHSPMHLSPNTGDSDRPSQSRRNSGAVDGHTLSRMTSYLVGGLPSAVSYAVDKAASKVESSLGSSRSRSHDRSPR